MEPVGKGPLTPYEKEYLHKDGHRVPILIGGAPVVQGEDIVMAFVIDRTREKDAQARHEESRLFNAVIRASPMAIVLVDEQNNVTLWNPAAEQLLS